MWILVTVFLVGLVVFHLLEPLAPVHPTYRAGVTRRGYLADLIAAFVNGPVLSAITKIGVALLVIQFPRAISTFTTWPWWAQFAVFFLANDFLRYWIHRWYHESDWLWRIHRVHHTIVEMDCLSVFRHHVLEGVIKNGVIFLPFQLMGLDETVIIAYSSIDIIKGFWHHANLRTYIGPLNYLFNSAELHWWHHSTEARGQHANYGSILSIWDILFGTFLYERGKWPEHIGVEGMEAFPDTFYQQFLSISKTDGELVAPSVEREGSSAPDDQPQVSAVEVNPNSAAVT